METLVWLVKGTFPARGLSYSCLCSGLALFHNRFLRRPELICEPSVLFCATVESCLYSYQTWRCCEYRGQEWPGWEHASSEGSTTSQWWHSGERTWMPGSAGHLWLPSTSRASPNWDTRSWYSLPIDGPFMTRWVRLTLEISVNTTVVIQKHFKKSKICSFHFNSIILLKVFYPIPHVSLWVYKGLLLDVLGSQSFSPLGTAPPPSGAAPLLGLERQRLSCHSCTQGRLLQVVYSSWGCTSRAVLIALYIHLCLFFLNNHNRSYSLVTTLGIYMHMSFCRIIWKWLQTF